MPKTFIIGNGFDLDLGLPTSYRDFADSNFWPITEQDCFDSPLAEKLEDAKERSNWFDIEDLMFKYACENIDKDEERIRILNNSLQYDHNVYDKVNQALSDYITYVQDSSPINTRSTAAQVLKAISDNETFKNVFSFNYTDLDQFCNRVGCKKLAYSHVHGSIRDNSAILGITDTKPTRRGYDFLHKTSNIKYKSSGVRYALQEAKELVVFGFSFGLQDYHYFSDFMARRSFPEQTRKDSIRITFITKDEKAQTSFVQNLKQLNPGKYSMFVDLNQVEFIRTADPGKKDLTNLLSHLEETSQAAHDRALNKLTSMLY